MDTIKLGLTSTTFTLSKYFGFSNLVIRKSSSPPANQLLAESERALGSVHFERSPYIAGTSWENYYLKKEKEMYSRLAWRLHEFRDGNPKDSKSTLDLESKYLAAYLRDNPDASTENMQEYRAVEAQRTQLNPSAAEITPSALRQ